MVSVKIALAVISCPACGCMIYYTESGAIEIFNADCAICHKKWQVVNYPDGRKEIREKRIN
jgi:uncharacterized Zn finger protein (UPF0148 family)